MTKNRDRNGELRADDDGKPASASAVESCLLEAFGEQLSEIWATMVAVAATIPPDELNRVGFHLYEYFRPDVPTGARGRDEKGVMFLNRIEAAGAAAADPNSWIVPTYTP